MHLHIAPRWRAGDPLIRQQNSFPPLNFWDSAFVNCCVTTSFDQIMSNGGGGQQDSTMMAVLTNPPNQNSGWVGCL